MTKRALLLPVAFALVLAACAPAGKVTAPAPDITFDELTISLTNAINSERSKGAVCNGQAYPAARSLALEPRLVNAALKHTQYMKATNTMSHTGRNGSNVGQRVTAEGYTWSTVGENIAWGQRSVAEVVQAWMDSKTGHCEAIMSREFTQVGAAHVEPFWALVFGTPR